MRDSGCSESSSRPAQIEARELCAYLRLAREWDLRFETLFRQGGVGKWYSSVGNEATTVAAAAALDRGDALVTLHRDGGAILRYYLQGTGVFGDLLPQDAPTSGRDGEELLYRLACQLLGRADGFSGGVERSYHFAHVDEPEGLVHIGMISHLGAMIPVAAGLGLGFRRQGTDRVALNFIGDGGTSTGDFHEGLNMAAVLRAPLVLVVENNRFAFSTPASQQYAAESIACRGEGYGIPGVQVDGNDPEAVGEVVRVAVARARRGDGPTLVEAMVGRMRGHSEGDRSLSAVPDEDQKRYRDEDPVRRFEERLVSDGRADESWLEELRERCSDLVLGVVDRASTAASPTADLSRAIFAPLAPSEPVVPAEPREVSYLEAISEALRDEMRADESVVLMGQDISSFGGAFTATRGFLDEFGVDRVIDTPIAESGTIGMAVGAALAGRKVVVEMQFADFVTCAFNQLVNVAAKFFYRTEIPVPLVVRLPSGGGVGAGAFHSQNVEGWFLHVPGLKVVAPSTAADAYELLRAAVRDPNPVLFVEHKYLYRRESARIGDGSLAATGGVEASARVVREGSDATVVAYGWMAHRALEAATLLEADEISLEVVDLRVLSPLDEKTIVASIEKTARALVVHEATKTGGFGAEIASRIADTAFAHLDAPVRRLTFPDTPVPFDRGMEARSLPSPESIAEEVRKLARW